jgi:hypothetical protein
MELRLARPCLNALDPALIATPKRVIERAPRDDVQALVPLRPIHASTHILILRGCEKIAHPLRPKEVPVVRAPPDVRAGGARRANQGHWVHRTPRSARSAPCHERPATLSLRWPNFSQPLSRASGRRGQCPNMAVAG